jgi:hypothetical protein
MWLRSDHIVIEIGKTMLHRSLHARMHYVQYVVTAYLHRTSWCGNACIDNCVPTVGGCIVLILVKSSMFGSLAACPVLTQPNIRTFGCLGVSNLERIL